MTVCWRRGLRILSLTMALALGAWAASADNGVAPVDVWAAHGPYSGRPWTLAVDPVDPTTVYTAMPDAIYKSVNGGGRWFPVLRDSGFHYVVIDPVHPKTIYAPATRGVFKSLDRGKTWALNKEGIPLDEGQIYPYVYNLFVNPHDPEIIYISVGSDWTLARSTDGGRTWTAYPIPGTGSILDMAFDPVDPSRVYAATGNAGAWQSLDAGESWTSMKSPELERGGLNSILVTVEPGQPRSIFISGFYSGRYVSTDDGVTWAEFGDPDMYTSDLVADPGAPGTLYADAVGVYKSTDAGKSWSLLEGLGALFVFDFAIVGEHGYASTVAGVFRTTDGGDHWEPSGKDLPSNIVQGMVAHPRLGNVLYGLTDTVLYKSEDRGGSWRAIGKGWPGSDDGRAGLYDLTIDPQEPRRMYAAAHYIGALPMGVVSGGVYRSDDSGATWSNASDGLPTFPANYGIRVTSCLGVAVEPRDPRTVYCLAYEEGYQRQTVYKSTDGADHWRRSGDGLPDYVGLFQPHPTVDRLYAMSPYKGFFQSEDRGETWQPLNAAHPLRGLDYFALDSVHTELLYASSWDNREAWLLRSEDGGVNWESAREGLPSGVFSMAFTPSATFAGTGDGVYKSEDGGHTWQPFRAGMPSGTLVTQILAHPVEPNRFYAGTAGEGIFHLNRLPALNLQGGRFQVEVLWDTGSKAGYGKPVTLDGAEEGTVPLRSDATSVVQFFGPNNWEMILKVLDGRSQNGRHWVLLAAATNVAYTVTVEDTSCAKTKTYKNPLGRISPAFLDDQAFADCAAPAAPDCQEDATTLCLGPDRRFRARVAWTDAEGHTGFGRQVETSAGAGYSKSSALFYFFGPDNWELLLKVLDGCKVNGRYWVLGTSPTNVGYTIRVIDTVRNETREYRNPRGTAAPAILDDRAFSCGSP